jgi:hypothetical protein
VEANFNPKTALNANLCRRHTPLTEFGDEATRLDFAPGARYQYSSMGILLAARVAEVISGTDILTTPAQRARFSGPTLQAKPFASCSHRCRAARHSGTRAMRRRRGLNAARNGRPAWQALLARHE